MSESEQQFARRASNLSWTVSGDYGLTIEESESESALTLYEAVLAGGRRAFLDWDCVRSFYGVKIREGYDNTMLTGLLRIAVDERIAGKLVDERPGIRSMRDTAYREVLRRSSSLSFAPLIDKAVQSDFLRQAGSFAADGETLRLLKELDYLKQIDDTQTILNGISDIYLKNFPIGEYTQDQVSTEDSWSLEPNDFGAFLPDELYGDLPAEESEDSEETGEIGTGSSDNIGTTRTIRIREDEIESIFERVSSQYGSSYLSPAEMIRLQEQICTGVHHACRVLMTEGVLRSECSNDFRTAYASRQIEVNKQLWNANLLMYRRVIRKLKDKLTRTFIEEQEPDLAFSDSGRIVPQRLWRIGRDSDNKVFRRRFEKGQGSFVIDILIDSSGSQSRKQQKIAVQALILTEALTQVGLPVRVSGFSSFLNYLIFKRFRDYDDPTGANENLFEYSCAGNNRDGLAIRAAVNGLRERPEENKILIVLSDGRPNDIQIGTGLLSEGNRTYQGKAAVQDTAAEIRQARRLGIKVLGVFTGREKELPAEKTIYGSDFFYIRDIRRFPELAASYIGKLIAE